MTRSPALVLVAMLLAGCGAPSTTPPASSASPSPSAPATAPAATPGDPDAARDAGWVADLDAIVPAIERLHPDPYHGTTAAAVAAAVEALKAAVPSSSDDALMAGVMGILAMISREGRDGHTGAYVWGSGAFPTHTLPLRLWVFPEGVAVVDAMPPFEGLVGRLVAAIDGRPTDEVIEALEPLVPRDNEETVTLLLPRFLLTTEILHGAGLIDDPARVGLTFADDPSAPVDVEAIPTADYNAWATSYGLHLPSRPDVPYLARAEEPIWTRSDGGGATLYVQYNRVTRLAGSVLDPIRTALADPAVDRVVVDIRHNFGGETPGYLPIAAALVEGAPGWSGGLYLITGRNTFSAATLFAADLANQVNVTFVGETMGGSPSLFGNARDSALGYSGIVLTVATQFYEPVAGETRLEIAPDVPVSLSLADFLAGRDPGLAAIEATGP